MRKHREIYYTILIIGAIILFILLYNSLSDQEQAQFTEDSDFSNKESDLPIKQAKERITKKPFGIKISPENSPISLERFSGYHTGTDYEIFENEKDVDIEVFAICSGKLLKKEMVSGYGGALIQECELENQPVTLLYGHIRISSVRQETGDYLLKGDSIALLGDAFSLDTDNERKHLHIGIHKGNEIDVRGYVQTEAELNNWIDIEEYFKN